MTSKERMMCALDGGKPDRLPVTLHQWQKHHLDKYLGGMSDIEAFEKFGFDAQAQYFGDVGQTQEQSAALKSSTENWTIEADVISSEPTERCPVDDNRAPILTYGEYHTRKCVAIHTPEGTLTYKTAHDKKPPGSPNIWSSATRTSDYSENICRYPNCALNP